MKLPRELEVPGLFKASLRFDVDGKPLDVDIESGRLTLRRGHEVWARIDVSGSFMALSFNPKLAKKIFKLGRKTMGLLWMAGKTPGFFRAMQQFSTQSGAQIEVLAGKHRLLLFAPNRAPRFNILGILGLF